MDRNCAETKSSYTQPNNRHSAARALNFLRPHGTSTENECINTHTLNKTKKHTHAHRAPSFKKVRHRVNTQRVTRPRTKTFRWLVWAWSLRALYWQQSAATGGASQSAAALPTVPRSSMVTAMAAVLRAIAAPTAGRAWNLCTTAAQKSLVLLSASRRYSLGR